MRFIWGELPAAASTGGWREVSVPPLKPSTWFFGKGSARSGDA
ncbi:hypothetical protein [Novipirellula galeiformis]|nr:hypothetical protein [Novipirellula galeiformis]